ncbi:translation protein SH3-like domain-containing protein [Hyaloraphidium curvatum]|nr:translation protein SH3-like domain-containing protein [Hyaloraphidium curvatum]
MRSVLGTVGALKPIFARPAATATTARPAASARQALRQAARLAKRKGPKRIIRARDRKPVPTSWDKVTGLPVTQHIPLETRYYRVVDRFKVYKPLTNGLRNMKLLALLDHWQGDPVPRLTIKKAYKGGRNNTGRVTVRGRGGGGKRTLRFVDWVRATPGPHVVVRLELDPYRSGTLALVRSLATNELSYILACEGLKPGTVVQSFVSVPPHALSRMTSTEDSPGAEAARMSKATMVQPGNCMRMEDIPVGTIIHAIGFEEGGPAQLCRAAGTFGQLVGISGDWAQVRLTSGEVRRISKKASATIGKVGNSEYRSVNLGKAGNSYHRGRRPKVRGVAMNPNDHPLGGMRNKKGNRQGVSPWGKMKRGQRTRPRGANPYVITPKWKVKEMSR